MPEAMRKLCVSSWLCRIVGAVPGVRARDASVRSKYETGLLVKTEDPEVPVVGTGNVRTLHIDAETWIGGLIAAGAAHLAVARFLPPITTARVCGQRSSPTAQGPIRIDSGAVV